MNEKNKTILEHFRQVLRGPDWLASISPQTLRADGIAGLTGATLVLPQAVAFAAIAGLPAEYGFYAAIVTAIVGALLGSSWHAVSGPTTAISAMVFGALAESFLPGSAAYISAAIMLAFLVGLIQLALGLARLGSLLDFVSHTVMTGFVAGAALLILLSQIRPATGIDLPRPEQLPEFVSALVADIGSINIVSITITLAVLAVGVGVRLISSKLPNYLIGMAVGTALYFLLDGHAANVATVGMLPHVLPHFQPPDVSFSAIRNLGSSAIAIAIVGLLEAVSVARAIALRSGQDIDVNRELVGQGSANLIGSFFQCYPASASFTRSGVNFEAGAKTPLAAVMAAFFLVIILVFVASGFAYVPIPALAGVIILVALRLIAFKEIWGILNTSRSESIVVIVTFISALMVGLETAIYIGVVLSLAFFLNNTARPFIGIGVPDPSNPRRIFKPASSNNLAECPQLLMARMEGPLYFGSVEFLRRQFRRFEVERPSQKHLLFMIKGVGEIDLSGAELLIEEAERRRLRGGSLNIQCKAPRSRAKLYRYRVASERLWQNLYSSKGEAIVDLVPKLDGAICAECSAQIFLECPAPRSDEGASHPVVEIGQQLSESPSR